MIPILRPAPLLNRRTILGSALSAFVIGVTHSGAHSQSEAVEPVDDILAAASQRLADVESLHFTLEVEGETFIDEDGAIQLVSAEGDLARPDKVGVEFQVRLLGATTVSIRMITIGDESWTTDLVTGDWGEAPPEFGYNPTVLYDNQEGLGPVMGKLEDAEITGLDEIDDRAVYRITGTATSEVIAPLTAGTMTGEEVGVELWIDVETSDLRRVIVVEPENEAKDEPATWVLNLSEFNETVTIEPPE